MGKRYFNAEKEIKKIKKEMERNKKIRNYNKDVIREELDRLNKMINLIGEQVFEEEDYEEDYNKNSINPESSYKEDEKMQELQKKVGELETIENKRKEEEEKIKKNTCRICGSPLSKGFLDYGICKVCSKKSILRPT